MKLMTLKQYSKLSKASLIRKIVKTFKKMPKRKLAVLCYELQKNRLPTISTTKKGMPRLTGTRRAYMPKRTRRKVVGTDVIYTDKVNGVYKARFKKGSPEAKAWGRKMARLRRMRKKR